MKIVLDMQSAFQRKVLTVLSVTVLLVSLCVPHAFSESETSCFNREQELLQTDDATILTAFEVARPSNSPEKAQPFRSLSLPALPSNLSGVLPPVLNADVLPLCFGAYLLYSQITSSFL